MFVTRFFRLVFALVLGALAASLSRAQLPSAAEPRFSATLDSDWRTIAADTGAEAPRGFERADFDDREWRTASVPHNWDRYEGFRQLRHGNRHGSAWYRRTFTVDEQHRGRRAFLFFEGVGSYATVWVNGQRIGHHAGGLTTFTFDITAAVKLGAKNLVAVQADHPAGIRDLPWVCGGCERAYGFSEGSQPFGIFRPVHLVVTAPVRVAPFGVHVWNDPIESQDAPVARVHARTELTNHDAVPRAITLLTQVRDPQQRVTLTKRDERTLAAGEATVVATGPLAVPSPALWSPDAPNLYELESSVLDEHGVLLDRETTTFGIRTIRWPDPNGADSRLLVNGRPHFINGTCDYEHQLGANHAFTTEQVDARVAQIRAAGYNAFRDAHHPHNLRFQRHWDRAGFIWWTQFGAHIWFDNEAFRTNYKSLLRQWVKERRNSPSLAMWGLQNESHLPADFAAECTALIRELDPTASIQRPVTTCNGGTGVDWNVAQNWSGTYGGDPLTYADDLRRQKLVGEYGAWRSLGFHTEGGFEARGPLSEDRMTALMETKVRLAETVRGEVSGHFHWPFTTHSNPGRNIGELGEQTRDGIRPLDQIGPANNKGVFTIWGEPLDVYYMYRSNYAAAATDPMVYIVSHTWPDRWTEPGRKSGIVVYSNCDEVELFNDLGGRSLGRRTRGARGTHFRWDDVLIETNVLYAEGRIGGKVVARDLVMLHHLPPAPRFTAAQATEPSLTTAHADRSYLIRVNCGGPDYVDVHGQRWQADRAYRPGDAWGSLSWATAHPHLDPRYGSQRKTYDPIAGATDDSLYQSFRYGREELRYRFEVPNGDYEVELYFIEPWYGAGGAADCAGWRKFDVALNGVTVLRDVDLWREAGRAGAIKKVVAGRVSEGVLEISFPHVAAGQAVISAIAVRSGAGFRPDLPPAPVVISSLQVFDASNVPAYSLQHALDTGDRTYTDAPGAFSVLPLELLEAAWIPTAAASRTFSGSELLRFRVNADVDVFVAHDSRITAKPAWLRDWTPTSLKLETTAARGTTFGLWRKAFPSGSEVLLGANGDAPDGDAAMYSVFLVDRRPPPPPQFVRDVRSLEGGATPWSASGNLRAGREIYRDGGAMIVSLPANLSDADWVSGRRDDRGAIVFTAADHVEAWLAIDARVTSPPAWLGDWIATPQTVTTTDAEAAKFALWRQRFGPGQTVRLGELPRLPGGGLVAAPFVIVRGVRPTLHLEAEAARLEGTHATGAIAGFAGEGAVMLRGEPGQVVEWTVPVGVGDRYGLNLRYATPERPTAPLAAELTIIASDGQVLRSDPLEFPPVAAGRTWEVLRTRTGSSMNAGTYRFRLAMTTPGELVVDWLEVE